VAGLRIPAPAAYALSAALHAVVFVAMVRMPGLAPLAHEDVRVEIVEEARPSPPEPPPPAPVPVPVPVRAAVALRRPVVRETPLAPRQDAPRPPAPVPEAPPPPNAAPPDDASLPSTKAPVRIGISLSSSTSSGGVAAPAGNTLYGAMPRTAPDPAKVKPYWSEKYVPPTQVTVLPRPYAACSRTSPDDYPEPARRLGLEAAVRLVLTVDETGAIADAKVIQDPGHGFGPAAVASLKRHGCRFAPARKGDQAVATTLPFTMRFELP